MKKILTLMLLVFSAELFAQTYPVTSITISLPANPDAIVAKWGTGPSLLTILATTKLENGRVDGRMQESKLLVTIKKNGAKICGSYTSNSAPASNVNTVTKVWSGDNAVSLLGQDCTLPPGDYELSVQFFGYSNGKTSPFSDEKTKAFTIRGNEQQQSYQPPQAISPANGTVLRQTDIKKPIIFRWTPVIPRPRDPVTYRLRVWQLMQGQTATQAMVIQQPILGNDVGNLTQALITNLITGPCKPPDLCDFIWNVQAFDREGKPIGGNNGTSEAYRFSYSPEEGITSSLKLISPSNKSTIQSGEQPKFTWRHLEPSRSTNYKIKIVEIKGDQSPENALRSNKPHFEKDSLKDQFFQYPSLATFEAGKRYCWTIQVINNLDVKITESEINEFLIANEHITPPILTLVSPADRSVITKGQQPLFTWLLPNHSESINYKLKIKEILLNQSPHDALRSNKPHFEKDSLKEKSFQYPLSGTSFEDGKNYVWNIQAFNRDGKPIGTNNGTSEQFTFRIPENNCGMATSSSKIECGRADPKTGLQAYTVSITLTNVSKECKLVITNLNAANGGTIIPPVAAFPITITPNTSITVSFSYTPAASTTTLASFTLDGGWNGDTNAAVIIPVRIDLPLCRSTTPAASICGMKFNDLNGNGIKDKDEPGIPGWVINLTGTTDLSIKTDEKGNYCFTNLKPGEYTIKEEMRVDWVQTAPSMGHFVVKVTEGRSTSERNFGNKLDPCPLEQKAWSPLGSGTNYQVFALATMNGDLYSGGDFTSAGGIPANHIAKWNGTTWSALGTGVNGRVNAILVVGTDLYVGGEFTTAGGLLVNNIAKWDGTNWSALGNGVTSPIGIGRRVYALALKGSDLFVGGNFDFAGNQPSKNIAKWDISTSSWSSVGGGMNEYVLSLAIMGGDLYAGGAFTIAGGVPASRIAKWNGSIWTPLGSGVAGHAYKLQPIGSSLYVGGGFLSAGGIPSTGSIAKWDSMTNSWSALGSGLSTGVFALAAIGTNLYAKGTFTTSGTIPLNNIARWNGTSWSSIGSGISNSGYVSSLTTDGSVLYAGGRFTIADGIPALNIAKYGCNQIVADTTPVCGCNGKPWNTAQKISFTDGPKKHEREIPCSGKPEINVLTGSTIQYNATQYICSSGDCKVTYQWKIVNLANGTVISNGTAPSLPINFTAPSAIGSYQVVITPICGDKPCSPCGFYFSTTAVPIRTGSICGIKFNDLNGNGIQDKEEPGIPEWQINLGGPVDMVVKTGSNGEYCFNKLQPGEYLITEEMLAGWQQTAPSDGHHRVRLQNGQDVAQIDFGNRFDVCTSGTKAWSPLGTGVNGKLYAIAHIGTDIYVGGEFTMAGGIPANNIAKWNGTGWSALGLGLGGPIHTVRAICAVGTDLYVGGTFTLAGGVTANRIAKWNGSTWSTLGTGVNGLNGFVDEIKMIGNDLYVGGLFTTAGGISANNIAKWNGSGWMALAGGFNGGVRAIAAFNGMIYAGGISATPGGNNPTSSLYKWNGSSWSIAINVGLLAPAVDALLVIGPNLYVGGWFTQPWGTNRIAKWNGTTWSSVGSGTNGHLDALVTIGTDIYAAGAFNVAGGASQLSIAKWNGTNWSGLGSGIPGHVEAMTVVGADLYAVGDFTSAGGVNANYVAKYSCVVPIDVKKVDENKK